MSLNHTANLSGFVLGRIETDFCKWFFSIIFSKSIRCAHFYNGPITTFGDVCTTVQRFVNYQNISGSLQFIAEISLKSFLFCRNFNKFLCLNFVGIAANSRKFGIFWIGHWIWTLAGGQ
jgi:hypothetical protein